MGTTPRLGFPYPEPSDPPAGAQQIRALAEAVDVYGNRSAEGTFTVPPFTSVPSGGAIPGADPLVITFPVGRFTTPPVLFLTTQNLPANAPWVEVRCSAVSTTQATVYAYNLFSGPLSVASTLLVAWLAVQYD